MLALLCYMYPDFIKMLNCKKNHVNYKQFYFFFPDMYILYFLFLSYYMSRSCHVHFLLNIFFVTISLLLTISYCEQFYLIRYDLIEWICFNVFIKLLLYFGYWVSAIVVNQHLGGGGSDASGKWQTEMLTPLGDLIGLNSGLAGTFVREI